MTPSVPQPSVSSNHFYTPLPAGILKKHAGGSTSNKNKYPPGPPIGIPPSLSNSGRYDDSREQILPRKVHFNDPSERRVDEHFIDDENEEDYSSKTILIGELYDSNINFSPPEYDEHLS